MLVASTEIKEQGNSRFRAVGVGTFVWHKHLLNRVHACGPSFISGRQRITRELEYMCIVSPWFHPHISLDPPCVAPTFAS